MPSLSQAHNDLLSNIYSTAETYRAAIILDGTVYMEFDVWNGSIQLCKNVIDFTTRLGGRQLVVSKLKKESVSSSCRAVVMTSTKAGAEQLVNEINDLVGTRISIRLDTGTVIPNCYIIDYNYSIKGTSSFLSYRVEFGFSIMNDETSPQASQTTQSNQNT